MAEQIPSIGRIVLFSDYIGGVYPAIVRKVHDNGTCDLTVFAATGCEAIPNTPEGSGGPTWSWSWPPRV